MAQAEVVEAQNARVDRRGLLDLERATMSSADGSNQRPSINSTVELTSGVSVTGGSFGRDSWASLPPLYSLPWSLCAIQVRNPQDRPSVAGIAWCSACSWSSEIPCSTCSCRLVTPLPTLLQIAQCRRWRRGVHRAGGAGLEADSVGARPVAGRRQGADDKSGGRTSHRFRLLAVHGGALRRPEAQTPRLLPPATIRAAFGRCSASEP